MKISCTQEKLNKGLSAVSRIVGIRTTLPVLSNICLEAKHGSLEISATDLEIGIRTKIGAKIDKDGAITIPARLLSEFVANNSDENIDLELKETTLHLKSQRYEANIKGIDFSEFPQVPTVSDEAIVEIRTEVLTKSISEVIIAAATDDTRPVLSGIYFKFVGGTLYMVATDSYRLAEKTIEIPKVNKDCEFIVPTKTMHEVLRITSLSAEEKVKIFISENQVAFSAGESEIVSRLIEGAFPNYKQIIPASFKTTADINLVEFSSAVKMAALFARQGANNIRIKFAPSEVIISSVADQVGDNVAKIAATSSAESEEITFNAKYLLDILQVLPDKKVIFEVNDKMSPGLIRGEKTKDYLYIIMPLRVEE